MVKQMTTEKARTYHEKRLIKSSNQNFTIRIDMMKRLIDSGLIESVKFGIEHFNKTEWTNSGLIDSFDNLPYEIKNDFSQKIKITFNVETGMYEYTDCFYNGVEFSLKK